jgi:hypothetical protein
MESERLLHPIINQMESTQNGVIKEEKNSRYDNQPYGKNLTHRKGKYV